jgi:copper chaperone CopZ
MLASDTLADAQRRTRRLLLLAGGAIIVLGLVGQGLSAATPTAQRVAKSDLKTVVIPVEGMACVACAASVKRALKSIDGVSEVEVNLEQRAARVTYAPAKVAPDRLVAAIHKLGYRAGTPKEVE